MNQKQKKEYYKDYYQVHKKNYRERLKQWRRDNPEKVKRQAINQQEYRSIKYKKKRQFVRDYKLLKGCAICGYNNCAGALVFHHPNNDKEFVIGSSMGKPIKDIKKEMGKCIVLCANCHAELHEKILKGKL
ncbi:MAG: hypothetical protein E3J83_03500 [Candidatus Atribacteria bacterium]|nr:MAG: hypothetical protein E3J83_03500 [Candidatus Atribacteria bacterium]